MLKATVLRASLLCALVPLASASPVVPRHVESLLRVLSRAGADASPAFYREHGRDTIPARGPLAALTAPGAPFSFRP